MITSSYVKAPITLSVKLDLGDDSIHSNQCKSVHKKDVENLFYLFHKMENHKQMTLYNYFDSWKLVANLTQKISN